jgi:formate dehydrogenase assembly factor FdhD
MSDKFSISPTEIQRLDGSNVRTQPDFVVVEEPLEIKLVMGQMLVDDSNADTLSTPRAESESNAESQATSPIEKPLSITMRTPGNDINLAVGFLFSEGIIKSQQDLDYIKPGNDPNGNAIIAKLTPRFSGFGEAGKAFLHHLKLRCVRKNIHGSCGTAVQHRTAQNPMEN